MHQIINACSIYDRNMPNEKRTMMLRNTSSKLQIVTATQHKQMSDVEVEAPPLRQRCFQDVIECVRLESIVYLSNEELGCICFLHHVEDVLGGNVNVMDWTMCMQLDIAC